MNSMCSSGFLDSLQFPSLNTTWFISSDAAYLDRSKGFDIRRILQDTSIQNNNYIRKLLLYNMVYKNYYASDFKDGLVMKPLYSSPLLANPGAFSNQTREKAIFTMKQERGNWTIVSLAGVVNFRIASRHK